jgi:hypothetical protein
VATLKTLHKLHENTKTSDASAQPFALSPHIIGISLALLFVTCVQSLKTSEVQQVKETGSQIG